jgi:hypothetical protein
MTAWFLRFLPFPNLYKHLTCNAQVDHAAAFNLAMKGDAMGCLWCRGVLALCYLCGWSIKQDSDLALSFANQSSSTGYGQFCLGCVRVTETFVTVLAACGITPAYSYAQYLGIVTGSPDFLRALKHFAFIPGNAIAQVRDARC